MASTILNESKRDEKDQEIVTSFIDFLNEAVSPFHAVQAAKDILMIAGFIELNEADGWEGQISPGGKYFFTRNYSTIVAFAVGNDYKPDGTSGFTIVGAHTDSPCPKLKPVSNLKKGGFEMLNVQPYGGGLWHTWFDRDLSVAGRAAAGPDAFERALRRSFVVSSDMAHACHPNYADKHDPQLKPKVGGGMVLKHNANQRYATNAVGAFLFREIGRRAGLPTQEFAVRSDSGCGSTIGPVTAGLTGINVVDVGSPQLSMHSVRETMSAADVVAGYKHLKAVYETFPLVNNELSVDGHDAKRAKI